MAFPLWILGPRNPHNFYRSDGKFLKFFGKALPKGKNRRSIAFLEWWRFIRTF
jgi:hypothetical protein